MTKNDNTTIMMMMTMAAMMMVYPRNICYYIYVYKRDTLNYYKAYINIEEKPITCSKHHRHEHHQQRRHQHLHQHHHQRRHQHHHPKRHQHHRQRRLFINI